MPTSSSAEPEGPRLLIVSPEALPQIWGRFGVGQMFRDHEDIAGGHWTTDFLYSEIERGAQQLWVIAGQDETIKAALVTDISPYRNGFKTCMVTVIVGKEPRSWIALRGELEQWAKEQGCEKIEMIGRVGWKRIIPDWKPTHIFFEKALT